MIVLPMRKQPDLSPDIKKALWVSLRSEILAALGATATDRPVNGKKLLGFSDDWSISLGNDGQVTLTPRRPLSLQAERRIHDLTMATLKRVASLHPAEMDMPRKA